MGDNGLLGPAELAPIAGGELARDAAAAWNAMNVEARRLGVELRPNGSKSSYRTLAQQQELWNLYTSGQGNLAARPGTSNHGIGRAVDLATPAMRRTVDRIGAKYGWSKTEAPSEWWHVNFTPGRWSGPDPGPDGQPQPPPIPEPPEDTMAICVATMPDGRFEIFIEKASDGSVWHTWQKQEGGWAGSGPGKNAGWFSLGTPGK